MSRSASSHRLSLYGRTCPLVEYTSGSRDRQTDVTLTLNLATLVQLA